MSQGVRCPLKNCNKLFRNEKLLQMHVKHYHPEYNQLVAHSPSVTDLAFLRTRLGQNFQVGGQVLFSRVCLGKVGWSRTLRGSSVVL